MKGVEQGETPKPEKFMELVYGKELVKLTVFTSQVKVSNASTTD